MVSKESSMKGVKSNVLKRIKPKQSFDNEINAVVKSIEENLNKKEIYADVFIGGSIAKGTNLAGDHDIDIFVRFDRVYKDEDISSMLEKVLPRDAKRIHGSRDYFQIYRNDLLFEIVPVLKIDSYKDAVNVTDVSPLHVSYFLKKTFNRGYLKDDVRLLKQLCKAARCYGAESYINGFSGHVLDLLVLHYRSFENVLKNAAKWKGKVVIDIERKLKDPLKELNKAKTESPLILVDPVQPDRNAAAALSKECFNRFRRAVRKFLESADESFFIVKSIDINSLKILYKDKQIVTITLIPLDNSKDVAGTKCLKVFEYLKRNLERNEFKVFFADWEFKGEKAKIYFVLDKKRLPKEIAVQGPPLEQESYVEGFKEKHKQIFEREGRIYAIEKRPYRTPKKLLKNILNSEYVIERVKKSYMK